MKKVFILLGIVLFLTACNDQPNAQREEQGRQQGNYENLVAKQPAKSMKHSSTRDTVNFWMETWDKPNKLSYVYLQASNGQLVGYYIFKGLPVSYCVSLTPPFRLEGNSNGALVVVPAPAMDGVYYGGEGACNTYYGRDATTDSYMEYTVGTGISALIYEEPLPRQDVEPLGFTETKDIK